MQTALIRQSAAGKRERVATPFETDHNPPIGHAEPLAEGLQVVTAGNGGPMTFTGTRSYLLGDAEVAIIDPGPANPAHMAAITRAIAGRRVSHIIVTHAHQDHSPAAKPLGQQHNAPVYGFGAAHAGRSAIMERLATQATLGGAEGIDSSFSPDITIADGEVVAGNGWALIAHHTPGHLSNHLCFEWLGANALFSGDHVMGWASTLISPPDGDLAAFMSSLNRLESIKATRYFPGHGAPIADGLQIARHLAQHRKHRGQQILSALGHSDATALELVNRIYTDTPQALHGAAARNVFAHLLDFLQIGLVGHRGALTAESVFYFHKQSLSK